MCDIQCPYKNKCTSHPHNCGSCSRNTGKRDYYKPRRDYYYPYYPGTWWPYTWTYETTYDPCGDYSDNNYTTPNNNGTTTVTWT